MEGLGFAIFFWIAFGIVGLILGSLVEKWGAGFFLGLFLGPFGWIIVFLLPRDTNDQSNPSNSQGNKLASDSTPNGALPDRDFNEDSYKIWLGEKYQVTRNDLFAKFECNEKLFDELEDALRYADGLEEKEREQELEKAERLLRSQEEERAQQQEEAERLLRFREGKKSERRKNLRILTRRIMIALLFIVLVVGLAILGNQELEKRRVVESTAKQKIADSKFTVKEAFYPNGKLRIRTNYQPKTDGGKRDGLYESYRDNGQLRNKGNYKDGKQNGLWNYNVDNGTLGNRVCYDNGKRVAMSHCEG